MTSANKIASDEERVKERIKKLKQTVGAVELRSDLKEVLEKAVKNLETVVQNGI